MEVAVTLSLGGNQAADTRGGAEQKIIPDKNNYGKYMLLDMASSANEFFVAIIIVELVWNLNCT